MAATFATFATFAPCPCPLPLPSTQADLHMPHSSNNHLPRICLDERALVVPGYHERTERSGGGMYPGWRWMEPAHASERARLLDMTQIGAASTAAASATSQRRGKGDPHPDATAPTICCGIEVLPLTSNSFTCIAVSLLLGLSLLLTSLVVCVTAFHATAVISPTLSATTRLINNVNVQTSTLGNETALLMGSVQDHWSIPAMTLNLNPDAAPAAQEQARPGGESRVVTNLGRGGGRRSLFERLLSSR